MSNTTSDPAAQPTEEASNPAQPTTNNGSQPAATSAAVDDPTTDNNNNTQPDPTSEASDNQSSPANASPTEDPASNPSPTDAQDTSDAGTSPVESESPAEDTAAAPPSTTPSPTAAPSPTQAASSDEESAAQPTTAAETSNDAAPSPTSDTSDNNNNADSTTEDNSQPTVTEEESEVPLSTVVTVTNTSGGQTTVVLVTYSTTNIPTSVEATGTASSTAEPEAIDTSGNSGGGLNQKSKVAIGVVVPIAAIAILALVGLFWWKKRRARQHAEEERRKEVEDYAYNPNADPTIPTVGMSGGDGGYEMREDGASGYRGWGNTTIGSTGRKASTTLSGGVGQAYSDVTSPTRGNMSDARSGEPLMDGSHSPEGEILGAMGPSAANNRGADVHRGPSNASSSYSAAGRSDASDPMAGSYGAGGQYYDQYAHNNPYNDNGYGQQPGVAPVIRDNPARRNTRIEGPGHFPQQSAGISQNF